MTEQAADLARKRFAIITLIKLAGIILMLGGMGLILKTTGNSGIIAGWCLFAVGALTSLILVRILSRRWSSPS